MKHLKDDERLSFIEGHPARETAEHVQECAQCANEVAAARRSVQRLENLEWPMRMPRRASVAAPIFKWALAACLVLCAGFGIGRLSTPNAAEIQAAVRAQLAQELRQDVIAYLNEQAKMRETAPQESLRPILTVLTELRDQQSANYLSLRADLETLASNADARLRSTRQMIELAAANSRSSSDQTQ